MEGKLYENGVLVSCYNYCLNIEETHVHGPHDADACICYMYINYKVLYSAVRQNITSIYMKI